MNEVIQIGGDPNSGDVTSFVCRALNANRLDDWLKSVGEAAVVTASQADISEDGKHFKVRPFKKKKKGSQSMSNGNVKL